MVDHKINGMNGKPVDNVELFTLPDGMRAVVPRKSGVAEYDINFVLKDADEVEKKWL